MKITLVGGSISTSKNSEVVDKINLAIHRYFDNDKCFTHNGVLPVSIEGSDLTIWMPDIPNECKKNYPVKDKGSILICSKVMRSGYTKMDAVSRIFKMHGNAVIAIHREGEVFCFTLIDALGNVWTTTNNINTLVKRIKDFVDWTRGSIRLNTKQATHDIHVEHTANLDHFMEINAALAERVTNAFGDRYFGNISTRCTNNISTRCMKLFPSKREEGYGLYLFSPRNSNKKSLTAKDMVLVNDNLQYYGERKPSVDTPIQLCIYKLFPDIQYMIHGHATVERKPTTREYYPCGDLRELAGIIELLHSGQRVINLRNHGFLITATTLTALVYMTKNLPITINN